MSEGITFICTDSSIQIQIPQQHHPLTTEAHYAILVVNWFSVKKKKGKEKKKGQPNKSTEDKQIFVKL